MPPRLLSLGVFALLGCQAPWVAARPDTIVIVTVGTRAAATVEEVEEQLAVPLEHAVAAAPGLTALDTLVRANGAQLRLAFTAGPEPLAVVALVRDRLAGTLASLPEEADLPVVTLAPSGVEHHLTFTGEFSGVALSDMLRDVIAPALLQQAGVREVRVCGAFDAEIRIDVSDDRLLAFGLNAIDVRAALSAAALDEVDAAGAGIAGLEDLVVGSREGVPVHLRDVARVSIAGAPGGCEVIGGALWLSVRFAESDASGDAEDESMRRLLAPLAPVQARLPQGVRLAPFGGVARGRLAIRLEVPVGGEVANPARQAVDLVRTLPGIEDALALVTPDSGSTFTLHVALAPGAETAPLEARVLQTLSTRPGLRVRGAGPGASVFVSGPEWSVLREVAEQVRTMVTAVPGVVGADVDAAMTPIVRVVPDRARLADLGVRAVDVMTVVALARGGERVGALRDGLRRTPVRLVVGGAAERDAAPAQQDAERLLRRLVPATGGAAVPLAQVARVELATAPVVLRRRLRQRVIEVSLQISAPVGPTLDAVRKALAVAPLPIGVTLEVVERAAKQPP